MARLLAVLVWLAGVALAAPVQAHAVLEETDPADRTVLAEAPDRIVLRFNEPVQPVAVQVLDQEQRRVAGDAVETVNEELRIALPRGLANGSYLVSYRVISADAHPVSGSFLFAIGPAPETWIEQAGPAKPPVHWPAIAAATRSIYLSATMIVAGGAIFLLLFARNDRDAWRRLRPVAQIAALVAAMAVILGVGLQGALIAGAGSGALIDSAVWRAGMASTRGPAGLVAVLGLALTVLAIMRIHRAGALLGVAAIVVSFALSGHAATATPRMVAVPVLLLHALGVAFWLGAFVPLLQTLARSDARIVLRRFSWRALVIVPVLLLAGLVLAILQVRHLATLTTSNYGVTLLLKLALVAALLIIALVNRRVLTPRLPAPRAVAWLRFAIRLELAVAFLILLMTAILSQAVPPRSETLDAVHHDDVARSDSIAVAISQDGRLAVVEIDPGRAGRNTVALYLTDAAGLPIAPLSIEMEASNATAGVAPLRRKLAAAGPGRYLYTGPDLAFAGRWSLRFDVLIDDFTKSMLETQIDLRAP